MSKLCVVAIFDSALQAYNRPAFCISPGQAVRMFGDEVNRVSREDAPNPLNDHPEDFHIEVLAAFDDEKGEFVAVERTVLLRGKDAIRRGEV
jgi:hypothetical protein